MTQLLFIHWNISPDFHLLGLTFHWYGIIFGLNFIQGYLLLQYILKREHFPVKWADGALLAMALGTVIGARLGHILFYSPQYYFSHPIQILKIWNGGLASHGAAIGIIIALWIFSRITTHKPLLWILDRLMIPITIGCFLVRTGNLINSEIIGLPTKVPWAFIFSRVDLIPRHPSQLYEAISYLSVASLLTFLFYKTNFIKIQGRFTGIAFTLVFLLRFLIEFTKENQSPFENNLTLNMGQLLSIPFFIIGITLLYRNYFKIHTS